MKGKDRFKIEALLRRFRTEGVGALSAAEKRQMRKKINTLAGREYRVQGHQETREQRRLKLAARQVAEETKELLGIAGTTDLHQVRSPDPG